MRIDGIADAAQQRHRELAAQVLAELLEPGQQRLRIGEQRVRRRQAKRAQEREDALRLRVREHPRARRVERVHRDADRDRLTVRELAVGEPLEPVREPWVLTDFRTRWLGDGYAHTTCDLWSAGRLVAVSEQMMLVRPMVVVP